MVLCAASERLIENRGSLETFYVPAWHFGPDQKHARGIVVSLGIFFERCVDRRRAAGLLNDLETNETDDGQRKSNSPEPCKDKDYVPLSVEFSAGGESGGIENLD